jgi:hypothetical protein
MEMQRNKSFIEFAVRMDLDLIHWGSHQLQLALHHFSIVLKRDLMLRVLFVIYEGCG